MPVSTECKDLIEVLEYWDKYRGDKKAYTFIDTNGDETGCLTYADFAKRAKAGAVELLKAGVKPGDNVLLAYPPGLEFVIALFACMYAGVLGAPIKLPKSARNRLGLTEAASKIGCSVVLTAQRSLSQLETVYASRDDDSSLSLIVLEGKTPVDTVFELQDLPRENAFIQFTSGSTQTPKALLVGSTPCLYNLDMIRAASQTNEHSVFVSWLPHYHDLGLVAHILQSVFSGAHCVLLAPESVIVRPEVWLNTISKYQGTYTGAPDFAFRLCTQRVSDEAIQQIDLSSLKVVINAAEPISADTLEAFTERFAACGFTNDMFLASYGMAEATVMVTSCGVNTPPKVLNVDIQQLANNHAKTIDQKGLKVVGCGTTWLDQQIMIVAPDSCNALDAWHVGEVWVSGENVLSLYLNDEEQTQKTFIYDDNNQRWLRTGDLGFLDSEGQLYITGRLKDVVIVRGANYYPHEIEHAVEACHDDIRLGAVAAFNADDDSHQVTVVAELERIASRKILKSTELREEIIALAKAAVLENIGLAVEQLVLVKPGGVPRTTSGKVSRGRCKAMLSRGEIEALVSRVEEKQNKGAVKVQHQFANDLLSKVLERGPEYFNVLTTVSRVVKELLDIDIANIDPKRSLFFYGADSVKMIELQALLEKEFGKTITNHDLFDATTFEDMLENIVAAVTSEKRDVAVTYLDEDVEHYLADLKPLLAATHNAPEATEDTVLITGAAGFLGVYIVAEVMRTTNSKAVCLVRASDEAAAKAKILRRMKKYGVEADDSWVDRIEALPGDVMDPLLGIEDSAYQALALRVNRIIHCAAIDNFYLPYTSIRRTNVDGTVHALKFSLTGANKRFQHVSSCAASLFQPGAKDIDAVGLRNGYAMSKYVSEKVVLGLADAGYSAVSYRLGYLYHLGLTTLDDDDSFETLIVAMKEMGMVPNMSAVFDLVPIDHAAKCVVSSEFLPAEKPSVTYYNRAPLKWQDIVSYYQEHHKAVRAVPLAEFVQAFHAFVVTTERSGVKLLKSVVNEGLDEQMNTMFLDVHIDDDPAGLDICPPCTKEFIYEYLDDVIVGRGKIAKEETAEEGI